MKIRSLIPVLAAFAVSLLSLPAFAQQAQRAPFDVTHYQMDVSLVPIERKLNATVDVSFTPLADTRTVVFELNGSLKIESITRTDAALAAKPVKGAPPVPGITFVQDQAGVSDLGPSVRVDLGDNVLKGTPVTLRFKYAGVLDGPTGGPLLNKRLAYVGDNVGYLMYASRWFPFHDYAADPATADISISLPAGLQIVGYSDAPVTAVGGKSKFVQSRPGLIGNFAYGKYAARR